METRLGTRFISLAESVEGYTPECCFYLLDSNPGMCSRYLKLFFFQEAVARAFERELELIEAGRSEESYLLTGMAAELLPKRDRLATYLKRAGMNPIIPDAGYFMIADFSQFGNFSHLVAY